jgi:hypothetical protein
MTLLPLFLALGVVAGPAHAKKKDDAGVRIKASSDLMKVTIRSAEYDGQEVDGADSRYTTVSLLDSGNRFEGTYFIGNGIEVGGIFGYSQVRGTVGDQEDPTDRHVQLLLTGAYNIGAGNGLRFFVQPIVGIDTFTADVGEDVENKTRYIVGGADAGARIKLNKKTTFDVAAEGLIGRGKNWIDGEGDDKLQLKYTDAGLRIGISVRL